MLCRWNTTILGASQIALVKIVVVKIGRSIAAIRLRFSPDGLSRLIPASL